MTFHPLLAEIQSAALTLNPKHQNSQAIQHISKAFRIIQDSASLFGFDDMVDFVDHIQDLLFQLRSGSVPVTDHLAGVILAAADQIQLLLSAAEGGAAVDLSLQAALLETVFQMAEPSITGAKPVAKNHQPDREATVQDAVNLSEVEHVSAY